MFSRTKDRRIAELENKVSNVRDLLLDGCSLEWWIKQRVDHEAKYLTTQRRKDLLDQKIELETKAYESKRELRNENNELKIQVAQLTTKVEMLEQVIDVGSDVIDIKDLMNKLVAKMPEIKLDKISVQLEKPAKK